MCDSCLEQTFSLALRDESHYPPRCCGDKTAMLLVDDYIEYLPGSLVWDYQKKEMEYSVHNKFRIYCGNLSCASFIHPNSYQSGPPITAPCNSCASLTCVSCKMLIDSDVAAHECIVPEADMKFELVVREKNYQRCFNCGATIELSEACNHISCDCGAEFCYICGREWEGLHGCPLYNQPIYDEDGYNQEGFHRETGLNREGNGRFNEDGFDDEGFDRDGFDQDGRDEEGYDRQGFDEDGYDRQGYDAERLDREGMPGMDDDDREMARILQQIQDAETGWSPPTDDEGSDEEDDEDDEEDDEEEDDEREDREEDREDGGEGDDDKEQGSNRDGVEQGDEGNQREGDGKTTTIERNDDTKAGVDVIIVRNESIVEDESLSYNQHGHITATEDSSILPKDRDQDAMEID